MIQNSDERRTSARCTQCGGAIGPRDRFCPACGAAQGVICPTCGAVSDGSVRICAECGGPLPVPRPLLADAGPRDRPSRWSSRGFRMLVGATACLLIVFGAVAWIYFSAPDRRQDEAVAQIPSHSPLTLAIRSGASPVALIGTPSGLLVSEDRGATWQQMLITGGVTAIGSSPSGAGPIYLVGTHLWRGDAGGFQQVQTDLPVGAVQAVAVDPIDGNRVFAVVAGRGLFASADAGRHWTALGSEVPANVTGLVVLGGNRPLFFVATNQHGIFASADGRSWSNANGFVNGALPTQSVLALADDLHSGDQYTAPNGVTSSGALYAGTGLGLFKSIDQGQSWSALPFHHPIAALAVTTSGDHLMLAVDANGNVYRSADGGVSWR